MPSSIFHPPSSRHRRFALRRLDRPLFRSTCRSTGGGRRRAAPINYLGQALAAFTRAIRAHEKLIKLLPQEFDFGLRDRETLAQIEERAQQRERDVLIDKVYGNTGPRAAPLKESAPIKTVNWCGNSAEMVRKYDQSGKPDGWRTLTTRQKQCIKKELLNWEISMKMGGMAFDTFQCLRPRAKISLGNVARLYDIGSRLGHLAIGSPDEREERMGEIFGLAPVEKSKSAGDSDAGNNEEP